MLRILVSSSLLFSLLGCERPWGVVQPDVEVVEAPPATPPAKIGEGGDAEEEQPRELDSRGEPLIPDNADQIEWQETDSGLKYRILREGTGEKPVGSSQVMVHYKGWLDNGYVFDSSYEDQPVSFFLSGVIPGWTEGLQLVREGGKIELEIPSELGYGEEGSDAVPPNATLHFVVELLAVR